MLANSTFNDVQGAFNQAIDALGVQASFVQAKAPGNTGNMTIGFRMVKAEESEIVDAYGVNTSVLTAKAADFATPPEKFDRFTINGERFTVQSVQAVHLNTAIIGYKMFAKR